jgi:hypothetical protein
MTVRIQILPPVLLLFTIADVFLITSQGMKILEDLPPLPDKRKRKGG